jgi:2,5-dihydroxypyridine 5,6-dioxygenase
MSAGDRAATQLVGLARAELELCRVERDETVLIYSDPDSRSEVTAALFGAAVTLSDQVFEVTVPSVRDQRRNAMPAKIAEIAPSVDLLIDASSRGMLHGGEIAPVLAGGARILRVREPAAVLARLFPSEEVGARITQSAEILEGSEELHFTSADGSDLRVRREGRQVLRQYGYCAEPGDWDHWGTALATFSPPENAAEGRLVLAPGDVYFYTATTGIYVEQPVTLTVEEGAIVKVEGGADARRLEAMMRSGGDPDAGCISHAGWGGDPRADWNALELYAGQGGGGADLRSYEGGVVIAFGSNLDMGGKNSTHFHMDLAFRAMSVDVDGQRVLDRGTFAIETPR